MKKKVTMTCILKSGAVVKDTFNVDLNNNREVSAFQELQRGLGKSINCQKPQTQNFHFGTTRINVAEIAAITFKEK
jgi:hypothetical protein